MPHSIHFSAEEDQRWMRLALFLAKRGYGRTSPNPMVGAVIVKNGELVGTGWHRGAGRPHAEIEAIQNARKRSREVAGATIYVTLEPCSTHGRTPPCTDAVIAAGISRVCVGATDPNPAHQGRGYSRLIESGIAVTEGVLSQQASILNEAFNHWIVHRTSFVTVKAGLSLDGKIATSGGQSRWITGLRARQTSMRLRRGADAILVGVKTVLADNPSLTIRRGGQIFSSRLRRIILDPLARTPIDAQVVADSWCDRTTLVVSEAADPIRVKKLSEKTRVMTAPIRQGSLDLRWLVTELGREEVTHLLVEGGGVTNAAFFAAKLVQRVIFFFAPKIIGGSTAPSVVSGVGNPALDEAVKLERIQSRYLDEDLMVTARVIDQEKCNCG